MNYDLAKPCAKCPFRTDVAPYITQGRVRQILTGGADFACHATVKYDNDGDGVITRKSQHCAGVLIILEKENRPHQMMRICERIGLYDRTKLDMVAPVYASIKAALAAHAKVHT